MYPASLSEASSVCASGTSVPPDTSQSLSFSSGRAKLLIAPTSSNASTSPGWFSISKARCKAGRRRFASTRQTEPVVFAASNSPAREQSDVAPLPASSPVNTTTRGLGCVSKKRECTSFSSSSSRTVNRSAVRSCGINRAFSAAGSCKTGVIKTFAHASEFAEPFSWCRSSKFLLIRSLLPLCSRLQPARQSLAPRSRAHAAIQSSGSTRGFDRGRSQHPPAESERQRSLSIAYRPDVQRHPVARSSIGISFLRAPEKVMEKARGAEQIESLASQTACWCPRCNSGAPPNGGPESPSFPDSPDRC